MLKEMFPQFEEAAIQAVLDEFGGDIEEASAVLLSPGFQPSKSPKPVAASPLPPSKPVVEEKKRFEDDWVRAPKRSIGERLGVWLAEGKRTDVALVCNDGHVILAHKLVLATRSQILAVMLMTMNDETPATGYFYESNPKVPLTAESLPPLLPRLDMDMSPLICRKILTYLYTDSLEDVNVEDIPYLHEAALTLDLEFVKRKCEGSDKLPASTYAADFLDLLYDPEHRSSDLELVSEEGGQVFYVHKLLMSCVSEYFEEMTGERYIERFERRIEMKGVSEAELKLMVESVYADGRTRIGSVDEGNAYQVFLRANQFLFRSLQASAEVVMARFLDEENVLVLLGDEIVRTSPTMKRHCLEFISKRYETMQHLDGYKALPMLLQLEVEHYAAKRNEEMFTALIATMADGINISDFNSLVQDEIAEFFDSQLASINIADLEDTVKLNCGEPCDAEVLPLSASSVETSDPSFAAKRLLHPLASKSINYRISGITLAPPPSRNLHLFDDASTLVSAIQSVAKGTASAVEQTPRTLKNSKNIVKVSDDETPPFHAEPAARKKKRQGGLGEFGRYDVRRNNARQRREVAKDLDYDSSSSTGSSSGRSAYSISESPDVDEHPLDGAVLRRVRSDSSDSDFDSDRPVSLAVDHTTDDSSIGEEDIVLDPVDEAPFLAFGEHGAGGPLRRARAPSPARPYLIHHSDTEEEDTEEDVTESEGTESFSDSDFSSGSDSDSDSSSPSSSSMAQYFAKDKISAVFSPTKLSILATDISLMVESANFRLEAPSEHMLNHKGGIPIAPEGKRACDIGTANILLSGVSFALSFSFSFQNSKFLDKMTKLAMKANKDDDDYDDDSSDESSSSSEDEIGGNDASTDVPLLSIHNFTLDIDQIRIHFLPHQTELKQVLHAVKKNTSTGNAATSSEKAPEPKFTVFSRPSKYGASPAIDVPHNEPHAAPLPAEPAAPVAEPQEVKPTLNTNTLQVPLPTGAHPLLWFPHYANELKASLKAALTASMQYRIQDSLSRLTEHLNKVSIRQLSSLSSSAKSKPSHNAFRFH